MNPKARRAELLVQSVGDELVLYDRYSHRAHRLNPIASALWRQCDGSRTVEALASSVAKELDLAVDDIAPVLHGLAELEQVGLLETSPPGQRLFDRRAALIAAATLVPMVTTIVAPKPAHAQSTGFPPPPPPTSFDKFNGVFAGGSKLIDAGDFMGFSLQVGADVVTDVDNQGEGNLDIETVQRTDYDLSPRDYAVTITPEGTLTGEGSFVTDMGVEVTCSISGAFNANCNRIQFQEVVIFPNHIGTVTWEITVRR